MKITMLLKIAIVGITLLSSIGNANPNQEHDLVYKLNYLGDKQENCFDITVGMKGNRDGKILVKIPRYVGEYAFTAKRGNISNTLHGDHVFLISLEPNVDMEVNYRACVTNKYRDNVRPMIENGFFHFISETLLIIPETDLEDVKNVKYQFVNFPADYSIVTNHILNKREYEVKQSVRNLSRTVLSGGKFDVKTISIKNHPVHVIINGKWAMFNSDELTDYLQKIIHQQRKFIGDYDFPHFVVNIFDDKVPDGEGGLSGSLYENVLSMVVTDTDIKRKPILLGSLSHELFHAWLGNKIQFPMPQGKMQWFFEGVNDFYGWQLALEAGLISKQDYIDYYNRLLKEYALSPFKEATNDEIANSFSLRNPAANLAMVRGHIVFMEILNKLNSQHKTRAPLDAALKEIVKAYSNNKKILSEATLDKIFSKHLGVKIWSEATNTLKSGKPIAFSSKIFANEGTLQNKQVDAPDFGFDVGILVKEKKIRSLLPKSKASLAGLKESAKVINYGLNMTNPASPVYIETEEAEKQKVMKFTPGKVKKVIPQYG